MADQVQSSDGNVYESDTHALVGQADTGYSSRTWANTQPTAAAMKATPEFLRPPGTVMPIGDIISTGLNLIGMRTGSPRVPDPTNTKAFLDYTNRTRATLENLKTMPEKYQFTQGDVENPSMFKQDGVSMGQHIEASQVPYPDTTIGGWRQPGSTEIVGNTGVTSRTAAPTAANRNAPQPPQALEDALTEHARGKLTPKEVRAIFKEKGWSVDLRRGRYDYEAVGPDGTVHYIQP